MQLEAARLKVTAARKEELGCRIYRISLAGQVKHRSSTGQAQSDMDPDDTSGAGDPLAVDPSPSLPSCQKRQEAGVSPDPFGKNGEDQTQRNRPGS